MDLRRAATHSSAVVFGFAAFFALFFSPVLFSDRYLGDAVDQVLEALPAYLGQHVLWEPRTMLGYPLFANPINAYWYPFQLLRFIPHSYNVYEIVAFVAAACGTYGLVRSLTGSALSGIVGGLVYSMSGFMIGHVGHVDIVHPAAWVPYIFWSLSELRQTLQPRWIAMGSLAVALCALGGQPQVFVYALYLAAAFVAVSAKSSNLGTRAYVGAALLTIGLGAALAAISLVPAAELAHYSVRKRLAFGDFLQFEVPLVQIPLRLFFPYLLGQTVMAPYRYSEFNFASFAEMSSYVGVTTISLALIAIRCRWASRDVRFWTIVCLVALLLSTGNALGLAWITYHLPVYNHFRAPSRHAMELALAAAVLAGFGVAAVEKHQASLRRVAHACVVTGATMTFMLAFLGLFSHAFYQIVTSVAGNVALSLNPLTNAALLLPLLMLLFGAAGLMLFWLRPQAPLIRALLVVVVVADLSSFAWFSYWHWGAFSSELFNAPRYVANLKTELNRKHQRLLSVPTEDPRSGVAPNLNLLWDVSSARGYTPLELDQTSGFFETVSVGAPQRLVRSKVPLLDAAAVRYLIVPASDPHALINLVKPGSPWRRVRRSGDTIVFENTDALPHAWIVSRVVGVATNDALATVRSRRFDPRALAVIDGLVSLNVRANPRRPDSVDIRSLLPEKVAADVGCSERCFVVMSDAPYPGWKAYVDGTRATLYTADYALRGVFVPAGRHTLTLRFQPTSLIAGAAITGTALVCLVLLFFLPLRALRGGDKT